MSGNTEQVCSERVYSGGRWHPKRCSKPVTVERGGKPYCTIHDPERVAKKTEGRMSAWRAKWAKEARIASIKAAAPEMLAELKRLVAEGDLHKDDKSSALAVILKAEGRQP